jgi:hypothetical protein
MNLRRLGWRERNRIQLVPDKDRWWAGCEGCNDPRGFIKCGEIFEELRNS